MPVNFEEIIKKVDLISAMFERETNTFLDNMEYYTPPKFEIKFRGESVEIPMDFAELNNSISDFLEELKDALEDY